MKMVSALGVETPFTNERDNVQIGKTCPLLSLQGRCGFAHVLSTLQTVRLVLVLCRIFPRIKIYFLKEL